MEVYLFFKILRSTGEFLSHADFKYTPGMV